MAGMGGSGGARQIDVSTRRGVAGTGPYDRARCRRRRSGGARSVRGGGARAPPPSLAREGQIQGWGPRQWGARKEGGLKESGAGREGQG